MSSAQVAIYRSCKLANFPPVERILFFVTHASFLLVTAAGGGTVLLLLYVCHLFFSVSHTIAPRAYRVRFCSVAAEIPAVAR